MMRPSVLRNPPLVLARVGVKASTWAVAKDDHAADRVTFREGT